jgi:hypothetical protein
MSDDVGWIYITETSPKSIFYEHDGALLQIGRFLRTSQTYQRWHTMAFGSCWWVLYSFIHKDQTIVTLHITSCWWSYKVSIMNKIMPLSISMSKQWNALRCKNRYGWLSPKMKDYGIDWLPLVSLQGLMSQLRKKVLSIVANLCSGFVTATQQPWNQYASI